MAERNWPLGERDLSRLTATEAGGTGLPRVLWESHRAEDAAGYLESVLPAVAEAVAVPYAAIVRPESGGWTILGACGTLAALPADLLAEVADSGQPKQHGEWSAARLSQAGDDVLVLHHSSEEAAQNTLPSIDALAATLSVGLATVRHRYAQKRRILRLETILDIAHQWYQTHETEPLLVEMAEAATRLLEADRASIFLWDKPNKTLVGRPALGIEGGELRIPDDAGVVGQVVQTGEPRRVNRREQQDEINRDVDAQTKYDTQNLVCVPLRSPDGQLVGAFEVINKLEGNFTDLDEAGLIELAQHAAVALENTQEREALLEHRRQLTEQAAEGVNLIGESASIDALRSTIRRVAKTDLAILILGENGTGKEVVAQMVHYLSGRRDQAFIAVNCAAIAETLLESELFGHEKGAFTDAHETRAGKFELAADGTLFLDEIGDLSPGGQAKLLRVLEEKVVVRVGGSATIHTDARIVAATNQDLGQMVREKKFREDLFYRLNVVAINLPPLRDRGEDVLLLGEHFLADFSLKARRKMPRLTAAAKRRLVGHTWPGNVRELRNLMERLAYLSESDMVDADEVAFILSPGGEAPVTIAVNEGLTEATNQFQVDYIQAAIKQSSGNMSDTAERLGLHRSNLYRKMKQLKMEEET
jgi:Nif-specific regulatory protein